VPSSLRAAAAQGQRSASTPDTRATRQWRSRVNVVRASLDHAHIFASDPATTVEFFQTMFGASVVWDQVVAGARVIRLQIGRAFIEVYDQAPKAPRGGAFHHLGIETDNLADLVREMTSRGFVFRNPIREDKTFKYVMIAGPDELLIELFECHEPVVWRIRSDD
jgi:catechol 2,3-dioxygenase-like lactoylglutathione lyase family enzyme